MKERCITDLTVHKFYMINCTITPPFQVNYQNTICAQWTMG